MKVLKWILIIIIALIAVFLIYSASQPNKMEVSRSIEIEAPREQVFDKIADFHSWGDWSIWNQKDTAMKVEITGEMGAVGAKSQWWSNHPEVGNGSQEVVEVRPNEYLKCKMRFADWDADNFADFTLTELDGKTTVVWTYESAETPFYMNFVNSLIQPMIEQNYETSLNSLKEVVESAPMTVANPMNLEVVEVTPTAILSIKDSTTAEGISDKLRELYTELSIFIDSKEEVSSAGMPLAIYYAYSPEKVVLEAAIPYSGEASAEGRIMVGEIPAGKAVKGVHLGDYNASEKMHYAIIDYGKASGMVLGDCWEVYANDPTTVDSAEVRTEIYYPIR
jgi:effector-binding domain-containing protein/uncharacterized protein YndB with AHSA1/START domain